MAVRRMLRSRVPAASSKRLFGSQAYPLDEEFPGVPSTAGDSAVRAAAEPVQTSTLQNGVRIVSQDRHGFSSSICLQVNVGTRHEDESTSGMTHLLSRMAFQTSDNRSSIRMFRDMEDAGATVGASHGREALTYTADCLRTKIAPVVDALAETATSPAFKAWEISERAAVAGTVNCEAAANADAVVADAIHTAAFYDSEPLGQPLYAAHGATSSQPAVVAFADAHVVPSSIVLSAVNVSHIDLVHLAEESLGHLSGGAAKAAKSAEYVGGESRVRSVAGRRIAVGLQGASAGSKDAAAASVFAEVIGSGQRAPTKSIGLTGGSSRLGKVFSGDSHPLVVSAHAESASYSDAGLITVTAEPVSGGATAAFEMLATEIRAAAKPSPEEIAAAKGRAKAALAAQADSNSAFAASLARGGASIAEQVAAIDAVQVADVTRVATAALKAAPSFASVGDLTAPRYNKLAKLFA